METAAEAIVAGSTGSNTGTTTDSPNKKKFMIPSLWFAEKFPDVANKHGRAVNETKPAATISVKELNEDFLAEILGALGNPKAPTVYLTAEKKFFTYEPERGIYIANSEERILTRLSNLLHECAIACEDDCDTTSLRFKLGNVSQLRGVITKARGYLHVAENYFDDNLEEFIACNNGMLKLADMQLLPFNPDFRRRNKLAVDYDPKATCPMFLEKLMQQALDVDAIEFLQKWFGLALLGINRSQIIVLLTGTAGGGKGTFIRVVSGVIGKDNIASLRTEQLTQRFETSSFLGKTLLYGADVPGDFLSQKSAFVLKALTGGDPMTVEIKNGTERPEILGNFNVIVTSNARLVVKINGDKEAWRRRLVIIEYSKPKPGEVIATLSDMILKVEGSGVLNWALGGLKILRENNWRFSLSPSQTKSVDNLLLESESPRVFVDECLVKDDEATLTFNDCFERYAAFCKERGWTSIPRKQSSGQIEQHIMSKFGNTIRNDITDQKGKDQRGWKGLSVK